MEARDNKEPALYRDILKRSWSLAWKFPFLLIFGFFAAMTANGEQFDILSKNVETVIKLQDALPTIDTGAAINTLAQFWTYLKGLIIEGAFLQTDRFDAALIFFVVVLPLITLAQIAIINAAKRSIGGESRPTFMNSLALSGRSFLPVLLLNVVLKLLVYGLLALISYPFFAQFVSSGGSRASIDALAATAFVILVPLHVIFSFLTKFASVAIVTTGKSVNQAIRHAWQTFVKHWLIAIEMSFLLIVINIAISLIVVGTITLAFQPTGQLSAWLFLMSVLVVGAFLAVFQFAAWTILLVRLDERPSSSRLERWAGMLTSYLGARKTPSA